MIIYQFLSTVSDAHFYNHGNPKLYNKDFINPIIKKTMGELYDKTCAIEKIIQNKGYNLVVMWEDEWDKIKKTINISILDKPVEMESYL